MRYITAVIAAGLFLGSSALASSPGPSTPPKNATTERGHVWTNDDLERLRSRGLISIIGQAPEQAPSERASAPGQIDPVKDPHWFAGEAGKLQDELKRKEAELQQFRDGLAAARNNRMISGGVKLDQVNPGLTPADEIAIRESQIRVLTSRLDELADLARHNDIPPGVLRTE